MYFVGLLSSFFLTCLLLTVLRKLSLKISKLRYPGGAPFLGGVGIAISFLTIIIFILTIFKISLSAQLIRILIFAYLFLIIELFDDLKEFSLSKKIVLQIILIVVFLIKAKKIQIYFLPYGINWIISFLWIMGITNALNLLDIKDGLCSGVSLILCFVFFTVGLICKDTISSLIFATLLGSLLSFYIFNLPPAKMYLGNSGSHFLGFLFATLSIHLDYATLENVPAIFTPILVLGFPIIDTIFLILTRAKKGIIPLRKSQDHIFLKLIGAGIPYNKALIVIYIATFLWGSCGVFLLLGKISIFYLIFILTILLTTFMIYKANKSTIS